MGHGIAQVLAAAGRTVDLYEPDLARAAAGRERIAGQPGAGRRQGSPRRRRRASRSSTGSPPPTGSPRPPRRTSSWRRSSRTRSSSERCGRTSTASRRAARSSPRTPARSRSTASPRRSRPAAGRPSAGCTSSAPCPVMPLVELIRGSATDDTTIEAVRALAADLGKQVIVSADRPGFIVNRILMPLLAEAMRALEEGIGTRRGHRHGRARRAQPPDGAARPGRLHRPRRGARDHARPPRRPRRRALPRRRASSRTWWPPGSSARRAAPASSPTRGPEGRPVLLDAFAGLDPETRLLGETVRAFAREVVAPGAIERDETERFDRGLVGRMAELGLLAGPFPEAVGGAGLSAVGLDRRRRGDRRRRHGPGGDALRPRPPPEPGRAMGDATSRRRAGCRRCRRARRSVRSRLPNRRQARTPRRSGCGPSGSGRRRRRRPTA